MDMDTLLRAAALLGISPEQARTAAERALGDARHTALESLSDADVPADVHALALLAEVATGQRVVAVKHGDTRSMIDPAHWRPSWQRRPAEAPAEIIRPGYRLVTTGDAAAGNPVTLEAWLRECGYLASADNPITCWVSAERRDAWRVEAAP